MSRRDTIIIAVLVNAGLLMVLFATAMRSNKKEESKELVQGGAVKEEIVINPQETSPIIAALDPNQGKAADALQDPLMELNDPLAFGDEMEIPLGPIETAPAVPVSTTAPQPVSVATVAQAPSPTTPTTSAKKEEPATIITVTVKKGDALEKIARANHSSVGAIMKANNLTSSNLKIGQVLKVPTNGATAVAKKESAAPKEAGAKKSGTDAQYYTVKEGDSPWLIANRNNVKLEELLKLNGMDEQKARKMKPGDRLRIR